MAVHVRGSWRSVTPDTRSCPLSPVELGQHTGSDHTPVKHSRNLWHRYHVRQCGSRQVTSSHQLTLCSDNLLTTISASTQCDLVCERGASCSRAELTGDKNDNLFSCPCSQSVRWWRCLTSPPDKILQEIVIHKTKQSRRVTYMWNFCD